MCDFSSRPIPEWLGRLTAESLINEPFPLNSLLEGSLYYPCSGFDGRPVQYLGHHLQSFIYVDYGRPLERLEEELNSEDRGFYGYEILGRRSIDQQELTPDGWRPIVSTNHNKKPRRSFLIQNPYCEWLVFQRLTEFDKEHGPERFSLLYLAADGAAAYQALFCKVAPRAVAIIQPGTGFGGNYTDYCDPEALFAQSVRSTGSQMPDILLNGGFGERHYYEKPIWPEYSVDCGWLPDQNIHLWGRTT